MQRYDVDIYPWISRELRRAQTGKKHRTDLINLRQTRLIDLHPSGYKYAQERWFNYFVCASAAVVSMYSGPVRALLGLGAIPMRS